jgi:hypothetical protein
MDRFNKKIMLRSSIQEQNHENYYCALYQYFLIQNIHILHILLPLVYIQLIYKGIL